MTLIEDATETERGSQHRWLVALAAFGIPVAFLFSMTVVLVTALTDQVPVSSRDDLRSVELGWPLVWVSAVVLPAAVLTIVHVRRREGIRRTA